MSTQDNQNIAASPLLTGLPPAVRSGCRILIVGSFPSTLSLRKNEYYANPRNDFWKIMENILEVNPGLSYTDRILSLGDQGVGLWDVIRSCIRTGSSDISIRQVTYSDFDELLTRFQEIRYILCNGRRAEAGLSSIISNSLESFPDHIQTMYLPSSSPAHAIPFHEKCSKWMIIPELLADISKSPASI